MATYNYAPGLGNVGSYQASGIPWISSSLVVPHHSATALMVSFPSVTREVTVRNDSTGDIRVGFSANGVSGSATNYLTLAEDASWTSPVKVTHIYMISNTAIAQEATVVAALTGIATDNIIENWTGSAGVG